MLIILQPSEFSSNSFFASESLYVYAGGSFTGPQI